MASTISIRLHVQDRFEGSTCVGAGQNNVKLLVDCKKNIADNVVDNKGKMQLGPICDGDMQCIVVVS